MLRNSASFDAWLHDLYSLICSFFENFNSHHDDKSGEPYGILGLNQFASIPTWVNLVCNHPIVHIEIRSSMGWLRYPHWQVHLLYCQPIRSDRGKGCWWIKWWPCSSTFGLDSSKKIHGGDNKVTCFEEVVYFVKDNPVITNGPVTWQATMRVYSVWEQEEQLITFKLKKEWLNLAWDGKKSVGVDWTCLSLNMAFHIMSNPSPVRVTLPEGAECWPIQSCEGMECAKLAL